MRDQQFGARVRERRVQMKMTREELSETTGISLSFLGHIERGTRRASMETLVKLCIALSVSPDLLLQDSLEAGFSEENSALSDSQRRLLREITMRVLEYACAAEDAR